jgi:hypothetical protein
MRLLDALKALVGAMFSAWRDHARALFGACCNNMIDQIKQAYR